MLKQITVHFCFDCCQIFFFFFYHCRNLRKKLAGVCNYYNRETYKHAKIFLVLHSLAKSFSPIASSVPSQPIITFHLKFPRSHAVPAGDMFVQSIIHSLIQSVSLLGGAVHQAVLRGQQKPTHGLTGPLFFLKKEGNVKIKSDLTPCHLISGLTGMSGRLMIVFPCA